MSATQSEPEPAADGEVYYLPFPKTKYPYVSHSLPFPQACAKHLAITLPSSHVYVLASGSLSRNTDYVTQLEKSLEGKVMGVRKGMTPHTLWTEVLEITAECRKLEVDSIVTLGAGSLTDAAKIIALALSNDAHTEEDLEKLTTGEMSAPVSNPRNKPAEIPIISIPTSLSGGEYSDLAGGTNPTTMHKHPFIDGAHGASIVVLDPELTTTTPASVWLSTGIRAVDHCVEALCAVTNTSSESDAACERGLRLLVPGLLRCHADAGDLPARLACQKGVIEAVQAVFRFGVPLGASHGIGHQLGPLGVGHGETSCVLLPAVCKYNAVVNGERQEKVREVLWSEKTVAEVLRAKGLGDDADLGDCLDAVIGALRLPRSLRAVGVEEDRFDKLAVNSLKDKWCVSNPRSLTEREQVLEILDMCR